MDDRDKALRHVEFLDGAGQCEALEGVQSYVLLDADVVSRFGEPVAYTVDRGFIGEHRPYWFEGEEFLFVDYHLLYPMGLLRVLFGPWAVVVVRRFVRVGAFLFWSVYLNVAGVLLSARYGLSSSCPFSSASSA